MDYPDCTRCICCNRKRMAACAPPHTGKSSTHAKCRKHQTMALLNDVSIPLKLATNSNHQLINSSRIQPEVPQAFLLLGCHGELFEIEDDISQVMHPEAVCGGAVALPSVLGSLLHAPVCVGLQQTHLVTLKGKTRNEKITPTGMDQKCPKVGDTRLPSFTLKL